MMTYQVAGIPVEIVRSDRKTVGIQVKPDGRVVVRAPRGLSDGELEWIIRQREDWIRIHVAQMQERMAAQPPADQLTIEEVRALAAQAAHVIPHRVAYYAPKVGVTYGRITIRNQRSRWGSCSGKGNLNFNCLLMLAPPEVLDSVVVHELCHRKEMNHSQRFYAEVLRVFPDYWKWNGWLKEHGDQLMRRMTG